MGFFPAIHSPAGRKMNGFSGNAEVTEVVIFWLAKVLENRYDSTLPLLAPSFFNKVHFILTFKFGISSKYV